ncbi:hypothetical protein QOT17_024308 [Balamuthia mandrillaris]
MGKCDLIIGANTVLWDHISVYSVLISIPTVLFLLFLLYKLRSALLILRETAVDVRLSRATAFAYLWILCFFNLGRTVVQVFISPEGLFFGVLWVVSRFCYMFLQVSVIIFFLCLLLSGTRLSSVLGGLGSLDSAVLWWTLSLSVLLSGLDIMIACILLWVVKLPIYETGGGLYSLYWVGRAIFILVAYGVLTFIATVHMRRKEITASFYNQKKDRKAHILLYRYIGVMSFLNVLDVMGWSLLTFEINAGVCMIGGSIFLYYSLSPPLVYFTLLSEFFTTGQHWPLGTKKLLKEERRQRIKQRIEEQTDNIFSDEEKDITNINLHNQSINYIHSPPTFNFANLTRTTPLVLSLDEDDDDRQASMDEVFVWQDHHHHRHRVSSPSSASSSNSTASSTASSTSSSFTFSS